MGVFIISPTGKCDHAVRRRVTPVNQLYIPVNCVLSRCRQGREAPGAIQPAGGRLRTVVADAIQRLVPAHAGPWDMHVVARGS